MRDAVQVCVSPCAQPSQKHSCRAEHQLGVGASTTLSADGVTNATYCSVNILESFLRDSGGDSEGGDSTRLSDHDGRRATSKVSDLVILRRAKGERRERKLDRKDNGTTHRG